MKLNPRRWFEEGSVAALGTTFNVKLGSPIGGTVWDIRTVVLSMSEPLTTKGTGSWGIFLSDASPNHVAWFSDPAADAPAFAAFAKGSMLVRNNEQLIVAGNFSALVPAPPVGLVAIVFALEVLEADLAEYLS